MSLDKVKVLTVPGTTNQLISFELEGHNKFVSDLFDGLKKNC